MPIVNIKFDDTKIQDSSIEALGQALKSIVSEATAIPEVYVYADSPKIKIDVAPIEVFIEMSASKVKDKEVLFEDIKTRLINWKKENSFDLPITVTLTPIDWKFEVGI